MADRTALGEGIGKDQLEVAHQCGTTRFGHDPRTSVLDINCKAHDLENLYVVDGSLFPQAMR